MNNILVTGGLGYIGSHTVVALQQAGYKVTIIDDLSNTQISVLENITKITGIEPYFHSIDLKNKEALNLFFNIIRLTASFISQLIKQWASRWKNL